MSIRFKLIIAIMVAAVIALGSGYLIIIQLAYPHFEAFERQQLLKDVDRINAILERDLSELQSIARDWGYWNDTYDFAQNRNQTYIEVNLLESWLDHYDADFLRIDSSTSGWQQLLSHSDTAIPESTLLSIRDNLSGDTGSGFVVIDQQVLMIGHARIKGSAGTLPSVGQVIFGRHLDPAWVELLSERFRAGIELDLVSSEQKTNIVFLDEQSALLQTVLPVLNPSPFRPQLSIEEPRELRVEFGKSLMMMTLLALGIFGLFTLIIYLGLERILIRPLKNIQYRILSVTGTDSIKAMAQRSDWSEQNELETLQRLAEEAARILADQRKTLRRERDIYEHESLHDKLTGLCNRRGLERLFNKHYGLGIHPLFCAILDLDHFKSINDTYGHDAGDRVLIAFAQMLKEVFGEASLLSRSGGEEFVVIALNDPSTSPQAKLQNLLERVEKELFERANLPKPITVSAGFICSIRECNWSLGDHMTVADAALYEAKKQRNTLVGYQQVTTTGHLNESVELSELLESGSITRCDGGIH